MFLCPKPAFNQQVSGTITGYVTDQSDAAVAGATVNVTNVQTGVSTERTTEASGLYDIHYNLIPGAAYYAFSSTVTAPPNRPPEVMVWENVVILDVDASFGVTVDGHVQIGAVSQQVTVSGASPVLNLQKADVSSTMTARWWKTHPPSSCNMPRPW